MYNDTLVSENIEIEEAMKYNTSSNAKLLIFGLIFIYVCL